jgi:hypothetical protein
VTRHKRRKGVCLMELLPLWAQPQVYQYKTQDQPLSRKSSRLCVYCEASSPFFVVPTRAAVNMAPNPQCPTRPRSLEIIWPLTKSTSFCQVAPSLGVLVWHKLNNCRISGAQLPAVNQPWLAEKAEHSAYYQCADSPTIRVYDIKGVNN